MTYFIDRLAGIRWWLLALLIALAPFHAFLITWLKIPGLSVWREVLAAVISVIILAELLIKKLYNLHPTFYHLTLLDLIILAYAFLSLLWLPFQLRFDKLSVTFSQWAFGFRFDVLPFLFFFFLRRVEWPRREVLWKIFFAGAAIVLIFGILHALVLPQNFLTYFGYSAYQGEFQQTLGVSACQHLEHTDNFCRAMSTFGGPTRYGTYLLLILGMLLHVIMSLSKDAARSWFDKLTMTMFLALAFTNIILTFSRSIWIAILAMGIFAFFWFVPKNRTSLRLGLAAGLMLAIFLIAGNAWYATWRGERTWPPPLLKTIFVRESSTDVHADLLKKGISLSAAHPLGMGLGTVGPASVRFEKLLTENWYLQIALEMGWLGFALFLAILIEFSRKILADRNNLLKTGLFLTLFGISVAGLFTHAFEETTAMLLLMIFSALPQQSSARHS